MQIFKLDLLKKISIGNHLKNGSTDGSEDKYLKVLGHFDYMQIETVKDFKEIVKYQSNKKINDGKDDPRYSLYSMFLYNNINPEEDEKVIKRLTNSEYRSDHIFLVSALKINMIDFDNEIFGRDFQIFMKNIHGTLKSKIEERLKKLEGIYEDIKLDIFFCPGSFDIITITTSKSMQAICQAAPLIQDLTQNSKSKTKMFQSVNSYIAVGLNYRLLTNLTAKEYLYDISIRIALKNINSYKQIINCYKKIFKEEYKKRKITYNLIFGECDLIIKLKKCPIYKLLFMYGVRYGDDVDDVKYIDAKIQNDLLNEYDKCHSNYIRFSYTQFQYKIADNLKLTKCQESESEHTHDIQIYDLEKMKKNASTLLPVSAQRPLEILVDKCIWLLDTKHRCLTGTRIYNILKEILPEISQKSNKTSFGNPTSILSDDDILLCLGNLSLIMNSVIQTDNIQLDYIDGDDVEMLNPAIKFLYAYEYMLKTMFENLNFQGSVPLITLIIDPTKFIGSKIYLLPNHNIIQINLPSINYYNPGLSFPYIIHELAHYVKVTGNFGKTRNEAFFKVFMNYIRLYIWEYLRVSTSRIFDIETFKNLCDIVFKIPNNIEYNVEARDFLSQCANYVMQIYEKLHNERMNINLTDNNTINDAYNCFFSAVRSLTENTDYIEVLGVAFREARADMIMTEVCGLSMYEYIKAHFMYMRNNKKVDVEKDRAYKLRIASMLLTLERTEKKGLEILRKNLSSEEYEFANDIFYLAYSYKKFLEPLCDYLEEVKNSVKKKIENANDKNIENIFDFCKNINKATDVKLDDIVTQLTEQWYKSIIYWRGKNNGQY